MKGLIIMSDVEKRVQQMLSMQKRNSKKNTLYNNENTVTFKGDTYLIKNSSSDGRDVIQMIIGKKI